MAHTLTLAPDRNVSEEELSLMLGRPLSELEDPASFTWDVRMARMLLNKTGGLATDTVRPASQLADWLITNIAG